VFNVISHKMAAFLSNDGASLSSQSIRHVLSYAANIQKRQFHHTAQVLFWLLL